MLERGGRFLGAAVVCAVLVTASGLSVVALALTRHAFPRGIAGGWPLARPYNGLESVVVYYWPIWLPTIFVVGTVGVIRLGGRRGLVALGLFTVALGLVLGLVPVRSHPETKTTPGSGECQAIFGGSGTYGDNDETCYDVRSARSFDVGVILAAGFLLAAGGVGFGIAVDLIAARGHT